MARRSGQDCLHDSSRDIGESKVTTVVAVGQLLVVEPQQVEKRGVEIVDADPVHDCLMADLIGSAIVRPCVDTRSSQPDCVRMLVMVASRLISRL